MYLVISDWYFHSMKSGEVSDKLMRAVRDKISSSPFLVTDPEKQVQIISGRDEGIGLWITANYVGGSLGNVRKIHKHSYHIMAMARVSV